MLRIINIIAGLSVSFSAFAASSAYRPVKEEVVLRDVVVEPTNAGINPDARAYIVRGQVTLGSNSCFAQGLKGKLRVENTLDGKRHIVAYVEGRQRSDLICIEIYQPVFADVAVTVRGGTNLTETVFVRNVDEFGTLVPLAELTENSTSNESRCEIKTICTREYRPTICTVNGMEIKGNNRCEALANVKRFACLNGYTFQEEEISCRYAGFPY